MSRDGSLPPGVEHDDPHFNPPECQICGSELDDEGFCLEADCDGREWSDMDREDAAADAAYDVQQDMEHE